MSAIPGDLVWTDLADHPDGIAGSLAPGGLPVPDPAGPGLEPLGPSRCLTTVECWVDASGPAHSDSLVISIGTSFSVSVQKDRKAVLVDTGATPTVLPCDLTAGAHHLAVDLEHRRVSIDDHHSVGFSETSTPSESPLAIVVGGPDLDTDEPSAVSVAGLRFWATSLGGDDLAASAAYAGHGPPLPPDLVAGLLADGTSSLLMYLAGTTLVPHVEGGPWVAEVHADIAQPQQLSLGDVDKNHHGIYESVPYWALARANGGDRRLTFMSNDDDRIELTPAPDSPGSFTGASSDGAPLTLTIDSGDQIRIETSGSRPHPDRYFLAAPVHQPVGDTGMQTLGQMWAKRPASFNLMLFGWSALGMDLPYPVNNTGASDPVFAAFSGRSTDYSIVSEDHAVPFDLWFLSRSYSEETASTRFVLNQHDLETSWSIGAGVKAKASEEGVVEAGSVSLSANVNVTVRSKAMREGEHSTAIKDIFLTDFALVRNHRNAVLTAEFRAQVERIRSATDDHLQGAVDDFVKKYGTHYAHALTIGGGYHRETDVDKTTTDTLSECGLDVSGTLAEDARLGTKDANVSESGEVSGSAGVKAMADLAQSFSAESDKQAGWGRLAVDSAPGGGGLPVFFDLRPIASLLAPPHYCDDATISTLRLKLGKFLEARVEKTSSPVGVYFVELTVDTAIGHPDAFAAGFDLEDDRHWETLLTFQVVRGDEVLATSTLRELRDLGHLGLSVRAPLPEPVRIVLSLVSGPDLDLVPTNPVGYLERTTITDADLQADLLQGRAVDLGMFLKMHTGFGPPGQVVGVRPAASVSAANLSGVGQAHVAQAHVAQPHVAQAGIFDPPTIPRVDISPHVSLPGPEPAFDLAVTVRMVPTAEVMSGAWKLHPGGSPR